MKTHINVILDVSGSMQMIRDDTIGGFNTWLENQKKAKGKQSLTLTLFDTQVKALYTDQNIHLVAPLTTETYIPGGWTALLDAIGQTVRQVPADAKKVLVVIITDGHENSSREFTKAAIKALVEEKEKAGWTFVYMGPDVAAMDEAQHLGVNLRSQYAVTGRGSAAMYGNLSGSTMAYAAAPSASAGKTAVALNTVEKIPEDPATTP